MKNTNQISWWFNKFNEEEINRIAESIRNMHISQGEVTKEFEQKLAETLDVSHVICTPSGSMALLLALKVLGIGPGDEVIIPNRTWVATAHAPSLLGSEIILVDVESDRPIIDVSLIEERITEKTKAIIPVHMNGRSCKMREINAIAKKHDIYVIEDAAQAFGSKNQDGFLGTQSDIGCFSLSVAKIIASGQGGFAVTNDPELAKQLRTTRTNSVESVKNPKKWVRPGFNFQYTDIQASVGIIQLGRLEKRINHLIDIYKQYLDGLSKIKSLESIPVNLEAGEIPLYNEFLVDNRDQFRKHLISHNIDTRPFYPNLSEASYLEQGKIDFPNSKNYGTKGIYLPSGPSQSKQNVEITIDCIRSFLCN